MQPIRQAPPGTTYAADTKVEPGPLYARANELRATGEGLCDDQSRRIGRWRE